MEFTKDQKIEILNDWLELGVRSYPFQHEGYFTDGKAALLLKEMIVSLQNADKELELLTEYIGYVALSREEKYEPLDYDSWKENK